MNLSKWKLIVTILVQVWLPNFSQATPPGWIIFDDQPVDLIQLLSNRLYDSFLTYLSTRNGYPIGPFSREILNEMLQPLRPILDDAITLLGLESLSCTVKPGLDINNWVVPPQSQNNPNFKNFVNLLKRIPHFDPYYSSKPIFTELINGIKPPHECSSEFGKPTSYPLSPPFSLAKSESPQMPSPCFQRHPNSQFLQNYQNPNLPEVSGGPIIPGYPQIPKSPDLIPNRLNVPLIPERGGAVQSFPGEPVNPLTPAGISGITSFPNGPIYTDGHPNYPILGLDKSPNAGIPGGPIYPFKHPFNPSGAPGFSEGSLGPLVPGRQPGFPHSPLYPENPVGPVSDNPSPISPSGRPIYPYGSPVNPSGPEFPEASQGPLLPGTQPGPSSPFYPESPNGPVFESPSSISPSDRPIYPYRTPVSPNGPRFPGASQGPLLPGNQLGPSSPFYPESPNGPVFESPSSISPSGRPIHPYGSPVNPSRPGFPEASLGPLLPGNQPGYSTPFYPESPTGAVFGGPQGPSPTSPSGRPIYPYGSPVNPSGTGFPEASPGPLLPGNQPGSSSPFYPENPIRPAFESPSSISPSGRPIHPYRSPVNPNGPGFPEASLGPLLPGNQPGSSSPFYQKNQMSPVFESSSLIPSSGRPIYPSGSPVNPNGSGFPEASLGPLLPGSQSGSNGPIYPDNSIGPVFGSPQGPSPISPDGNPMYSGHYPSPLYPSESPVNPSVPGLPEGSLGPSFPGGQPGSNSPSPISPSAGYPNSEYPPGSPLNSNDLPGFPQGSLSPSLPGSRPDSSSLFYPEYPVGPVFGSPHSNSIYGAPAVPQLVTGPSLLGNRPGFPNSPFYPENLVGPSAFESPRVPNGPFNSKSSIGPEVFGGPLENSPLLPGSPSNYPILGPKYPNERPLLPDGSVRPLIPAGPSFPNGSIYPAYPTGPAVFDSPSLLHGVRPIPSPVLDKDFNRAIPGKLNQSPIFFGGPSPSTLGGLPDNPAYPALIPGGHPSFPNGPLRPESPFGYSEGPISPKQVPRFSPSGFKKPHRARHYVGGVPNGPTVGSYPSYSKHPGLTGPEDFPTSNENPDYPVIPQKPGLEDLPISPHPHQPEDYPFGERPQYPLIPNDESEGERPYYPGEQKPKRPSKLPKFLKPLDDLISKLRRKHKEEKQISDIEETFSTYPSRPNYFGPQSPSFGQYSNYPFGYKRQEGPFTPEIAPSNLHGSEPFRPGFSPGFGYPNGPIYSEGQPIGESGISASQLGLYGIQPGNLPFKLHPEVSPVSNIPETVPNNVGPASGLQSFGPTPLLPFLGPFLSYASSRPNPNAPNPLMIPPAYLMDPQTKAKLLQLVDRLRRISSFKSYLNLIKNLNVPFSGFLQQQFIGKIIRLKQISSMVNELFESLHSKGIFNLSNSFVRNQWKLAMEFLDSNRAFVKRRGWYELWYNSGEGSGYVEVWNNKDMLGDWRKK